MPESYSPLNNSPYQNQSFSCQLVTSYCAEKSFDSDLYNIIISETPNATEIESFCAEYDNMHFRQDYLESFKKEANLELFCNQLLSGFNKFNSEQDICYINTVEDYYSTFWNFKIQSSNSFVLDSLQQKQVEEEYSASITTNAQLIATALLGAYAATTFFKHHNVRISFIMLIGSLQLVELANIKLDSLLNYSNSLNDIYDDFMSISSPFESFKFVLKNIPQQLTYASIAAVMMAPQLDVLISNPLIYSAAHLLIFTGLYKTAGVAMQADHPEFLFATVTTLLIGFDAIQKTAFPRQSQNSQINFVYLLPGLVTAVGMYGIGIHYENNHINNLGIEILKYSAMKASASTFESISMQHTGSSNSWRIAPIATLASSGITTSMVIFQNWMKPNNTNMTIELISYGELITAAFSKRIVQDLVFSSFSISYKKLYIQDLPKVLDIFTDFISLFIGGVVKDGFYNGFGIKNYSTSEIISKQFVSSSFKKLPSLITYTLNKDEIGAEITKTVMSHYFSWIANGISRNIGKYLYEHPAEVIAHFSSCKVEEPKVLATFYSKTSFSKYPVCITKHPVCNIKYSYFMYKNITTLV